MHIPADASPIGHLFLYGTLMRGEPAHARFSLSARAAYVGEATVDGRLYDLGGYPTLVPGAGRVEGEVHRILDPGLIAELDLYEACDPADEANSDYVRRVVRLPEHGVEAWLYCHRGPPPDGVPLPGPRWRTASQNACAQKAVTHEAQRYPIAPVLLRLGLHWFISLLFLKGARPARPGGRRTGCAAFSDRAMDGESENPDSLSTLSLCTCGESVFLWFVSFDAHQKK